MSRIGKNPVTIPNGVTVTVNDGQITVKGTQGALDFKLPDGISMDVQGNIVSVRRADDSMRQKGCHGLARTILANMIQGVVQGYQKELEIQGVGFKASLQGAVMTLSLGFSAPVVYKIPAGIKAKVDGGTAISISGMDKQLVGNVAARIRAFAPAEPYKGKGVRYKGEHVRRKVGKTVA
ncbi:MAG: 50S ribosomal protein L6 [Lentisphaerae bacterium RIFOXYC12_FULL_60_16]|nr:MAG: 50S ribosomal protein L6 [Lentisphaerae bacterium RIFOXYC12_FULL_60_16]OGV72568.1 MAG: 50S ribosomal protein L6 [Lentisphaerae bacterium RIFOXYA12_FULL_60_10]OGV77311.1 MAG: 50S ribosomal protein L6 [Lentisphaerae bacterium RIFOXYB12_FULL_60_10]